MPARVVWCFIGAADAFSDPAADFLRPLLAVVGGGAGAWGVGVGVGSGVGSADSSAPVMDWKPASLAEVMVKVCRQMGAAPRACWVQGAACVLSWAGECLDDSSSSTERGRLSSPNVRGALSLAGAAAARVRCRSRAGVA